MQINCLLLPESRTMTEKKIGFVGTDGRTLLAALETSRSKSELYPGAYRGVVVKGTGAMEPFAQKNGLARRFYLGARQLGPILCRSPDPGL